MPGSRQARGGSKHSTAGSRCTQPERRRPAALKGGGGVICLPSRQRCSRAAAPEIPSFVDPAPQIHMTTCHKQGKAGARRAAGCHPRRSRSVVELTLEDETCLSRACPGVSLRLRSSCIHGPLHCAALFFPPAIRIDLLPPYGICAATMICQCCAAHRKGRQVRSWRECRAAAWAPMSGMGAGADADRLEPFGAEEVPRLRGVHGLVHQRL